MIHPHDPQAAMNAKYAAFARKNAATARRLQADPAGRAIEEAQQRIAAKLAARPPRVGEIQRIPADPFRSELVSIAAGLLHVCGEDPGEDEKLRLAAIRLGELANGAAPRASQAAGDANGAGDDVGAAHDPHGAAAGHTEPPMRPEDVPAPEHAHNGNEQANEQALRDRIASAIENRAHLCLIECDCDGDHPILVTTSAGDAESGPHIIAVEGSPRALADAAMAEVQPELDQHWADLACRTNERDQWREEARRMHQNCDHWRKRAEAAEAALATQNAENDRLDQLLIDERAITARLGRELAALRAQQDGGAK